MEKKVAPITVDDGITSKTLVTNGAILIDNGDS